MKLNDWKIHENIKSLPDLAKRLGVAERINPARLVHNWLTGRAIPNKKHMQIIMKATNGRVTPIDFYSQ